MPTDSDERAGADPEAILNQALEYASQGLPVIPLKDREKAPLLSRWTHRASTDSRKIRRWFRRWPRANLGIRTGRGLVVLDVDPKNGGESSLRDLIAAHGALPVTASVRSGSGGSHHYFRVEEGLEICSWQGFLAGVDILAEKAQAVAPPSIHPDTGHSYEWVRPPSEGIAPIPAWLLDALITPSADSASSPDDGRDDGPPGRRSRSDSVTAVDLSRRKAVPRAGASKQTTRGGPTQAREAWRPTSRMPLPRVSGDVDALLSQIIVRFPIPDVGHRHNLMVKAVGSLVGSGYGDEVVIEALMAWWLHFFDLGVVRTERDEMERELRTCLACTRANSKFRRAAGQAGYIAAATDVRFRNLEALFRLPVSALLARVSKLEAADQTRTPEGEPPHHCIGVTRISVNQCKLCQSAAEELFVESVLAYAWLQLGGEPVAAKIRFTHDQIRSVAAVRGGRHFPVWDNQQFDRLKRKFIAREGKPASRFELLEEVTKGQRGRNGQAGTPSGYEPTGILPLLGAETMHPEHC